ncbi:hypothetical protein Tco_0719882 [Tanacetum coccineum]
MAAFSSSSYISNLVKINHAARLRLRPDILLKTRPIPTANLTSNWDAAWKPDQGSKAPLLSDILWPSAGAFAAMAVLGKMDQMLVNKGVSITIAPLGAVCAILFATPSTPGARELQPNIIKARVYRQLKLKSSKNWSVYLKEQFNSSKGK